MMKNEPTVSTRLPSNLKILFEDQHLLVLSKPAGLLSQGAQPGDPNLVDLLRVYLGRHYVGLIHRLDRNTSGLMVVAKRSKSAQRLTDALQKDEIERNYLAWVFGRLSSPVQWSHQLMKDEKRNLVRVTARGGKSALLMAHPKGYGVWKGQAVSLVEFQLETGRSHQIRVQSAFEGFPLLGDQKYGPSQYQRAPFPRVALHSYFLQFPHPMSKEILKFEDALPDDLSQIQILSEPSQNPSF